MAEQINSSGDKSIQALTDRAQTAARAVDSWSNWYVWFVALGVVVAAFVFVAQFKVIRKAKELADAQDALSLEKDRQGAVDSKNKDLEIAAAKAAAATANEKAAALEKEALALRLELAKIAPVNLPIKSIVAEVTLIIKGSVADWPLAANWPAPQKPVGSFSLDSQGGALVILRCRQLETMRVVSGPNAKPAETVPLPDGRTFSMSFSWPSNDLVIDAQTGGQSKFKYWIDRNNVSTTELEKEMRGAMIDIPFLDKGAEIASGSCTVTINGSIQKTFLVPKAVTENGMIFLSEDKPK